MRVPSKTASLGWLRVVCISFGRWIWEFRLISAPGSSLPSSAYFLIENSRILKQECFPYVTKNLFSPNSGFVWGIHPYSKLGQLAPFPASLPGQQYPRGPVGGIGASLAGWAITSLHNEHFGVLANNPPISPLSSSAPLWWMPSAPGDLSTFSLSIK